MTAVRWSLWIDTGGTFTDCLALAPDGSLRRAKVLSSGCLRGRIDEAASGGLRISGPWPAGADSLRGFQVRHLGRDLENVARITDVAADGRVSLEPAGAWDAFAAGDTVELLTGESAPVLAARLVTGTPPGQLLPALDLRLATTRGTNALLERKGARTALIVSRGFRDLLKIGTQQRPDLFALRIERPPPLPETTLEIGGRIDARGGVVEPLGDADLEAVVRATIETGCDAVAVSLINAWANPDHEQRLGAALRDAGALHVTLGSELSRTLHYLNRTRTAVTNAYLAPVLEEYLASVAAALGDGSGIQVMTSAGGLVDSSVFRPRDSLLSGPAAGVVGAVAAGAAAGFEKVISFDMGGTSTDVARVDGDVEYRWTHTVGDSELVAPAVAIDTVAAGGGSICGYRLGALFVGPQSAGASPGPACYGAGGPLTLTDCNLLLGRLDETRFEIPLDAEAARSALDAVRREMQADGRSLESDEILLSGFVDIANERMADAIRGVSVRKGFDPADHALVSFGGAGGQHACEIADRLGIRTVIIPADPALLSARGLGIARREVIAERQILRPLGDGAFLNPIFDALEKQATEELAGNGGPAPTRGLARRTAEVRLDGQDSTLSLEPADGRDLPSLFADRYRHLYGYPPGDQGIEVESVRVVVREGGSELAIDETVSIAAGSGATSNARVWVDQWVEVPRCPRGGVGQTERPGPLLVLDPYSTIVIPEGWTVVSGKKGELVLSRNQLSITTIGMATQHAVRERLFTSRFESLVSQMGEQLLRTASSVNVKERMDFSCALLSARGELIANAPHIPVHLGALGLCVRTVADHIEMRPGDVVVTNSPRYGGSHLPDVTVISPVFAETTELVGFVANRAHHAEIGGTRPGSMPPDAKKLEEEGILIPPTRVIAAGEPRWEAIRAIFETGPAASRAPAENLADLRAQVAANHHGAKLLRKMAAEHGVKEVGLQMERLAQRSARLAKEALGRMGSTTCTAVEELDDGSRLAVRIEIEGGHALFDFTGTSGVHPGNLNATPAIVRSTVVYILRLLVSEAIPLNEGLLRPVTIRIPECLLNPPFPDDPGECPAVVGGNTEVSQRLTDTLIRALQLSACGQGTMNNVLFGNARFGFYETVAGGAGAGEGFAGESGVHTHMTNTRITDAEVIEYRYPVRVREMALRRRSGGDGRWRGGDGVRRTMEFLETVQLSLLSQHRRVRPFGIDGAEPGAVGRQWIERVGGNRTVLHGNDAAEVEPGDWLTIETPGGGGWGSPNRQGRVRSQ